jgi:hypothetical protein
MSTAPGSHLPWARRAYSLCSIVRAEVWATDEPLRNTVRQATISAFASDRVPRKLSRRSPCRPARCAAAIAGSRFRAAVGHRGGARIVRSGVVHHHATAVLEVAIAAAVPAGMLDEVTTSDRRTSASQTGSPVHGPAAVVANAQVPEGIAVERRFLGRNSTPHDLTLVLRREVAGRYQE